MKTFDQLIITTGFLASASPAMADEEPEADSGRPNILFILSDDHTSQAWGIYGGILSEYVKNENIRRLAAEGCVLDNCFCTNSISVPSRAAIMTGAYSHHNGVETPAGGRVSDCPFRQMASQDAAVGFRHLFGFP